MLSPLLPSHISCIRGSSSAQQGTHLPRATPREAEENHKVSPFLLLPGPGSSLPPSIGHSSHLPCFLPFVLPALQGCSPPTSACTTRDFPFLSPTNPVGKLLPRRRKGSSLCTTFLDLDIILAWSCPENPGPCREAAQLSWTQSRGPCAACSQDVARAA